MSYLGNTPTTQSFIAGTDTFSGTGSQTVYTLTRAVNSVNDILVVVNNVDQQPTAYTVSGSTLTFTAAPSSGTNNIYVRYLSTTLQTFAPSQGSVSPTTLTTGGLYWDASGNVGVGTTAPLNLAGYNTLSINDTTSGILEIEANNVSKFLAYYDSANTAARLSAVDSLIFDAGSVAQGRITTTGLFQFNSGYGSVATAYGCRAWVNFNGTGTVAIRASGNVTSITDNGTGDYTVNFTTAMPDANYNVVGALGGSTIQGIDIGNLATVAPTTTTLRFLSRGTTTGSPTDATYANISIFR